MDIYQHFRPEEKDFIDQVLGWAEQVREQYAPKLTDFLNPREAEIIRMLIGKGGDVLVSFFGGADHAERKRAIFYPEYYTPDEEDYEIAFYQLSYPSKFTTIDHRQVLGTLMSLGLKREMYGDIWIEGETVQFAVAKTISAYVEANLSKIGNAGVKCEPISSERIIAVKETWKETAITSSSLRLDNVVANAVSFSRQKSQMLIGQGRVKVNHRQIESVSYELKQEDIISIRGTGRIKVLAIDGKTKKDKWKIVIGLQK